MNKLPAILCVLAVSSLLNSSCVPAQTTGTVDTTPTTTATSTMTPSPAPTSTNTPIPTETPTITPTPPVTVRVPEDQPTIQAGIDTAPDGGMVLVAPGIYSEQLTISDKAIILASYFHTTGEKRFIDETVIDGNGGPVITVTRTVGLDAKVIGFTIQNGDDGIKARGNIHVLNNRFWQNKDGVDYQDCGGLNSGNVYEDNKDDGVDLDGSSEVIVENNIIRNNKNDGIEIRLHEYSGPTLNIIIRDNIISGNVQDGIQLIDYPDLSDRVFLIERNLIQGNRKAGLGIMDNAETQEDFRGASMPERVHLFNNTFTDNPYGVSGGDNLIALNNLFLNSSTLALKNVDANSIATHNLFWNNALDSEGSNVDVDTSLFSDPLLDAEYQFQPGSPAIDSGIARFEWKGEILLDLPSSAYFGAAPDLGAYESNDS